MSLQSSYSSAGSLPFKLFRNQALMRRLEEGVIPPVHVQFIPTNRCNLSCSFCSCSERDQTREMDLSEVQTMVPYLKALGCQSVTITGGGEPLLHPDIVGIIETFAGNGIRVGLVTNGLLLDSAREVLRFLTWCRVSCSDENPFGGRFAEVMTRAVEVPIDWAFSYVLTDRPQVANLIAHIAFANQHGFTHVRVVSDILEAESSHMAEVIPAVREAVDDSRVIWQPRQEWTAGRSGCFISLLKPVIGPDGKVFPCCGVQYAESEAARDLPDSMCMGEWAQLGVMRHYDGSACVKCYYEGYNLALNAMLDNMAHREFV